MDKQKHYSGLTSQQVEESRKINGTNLLTPPKRAPLWKLFLEKFEDPIIRILLIAAVLSLGISFVHWEFAETIGIFCAIFLATGVGFWFEMDANKKFDILNKVNEETKIKVIRNGNICEVPKKDIVVGDIVVIETGEEVPADGELLEAVSLIVDESCLTGEMIAHKTIDPEHFDKDATYPSNWIMRGTTLKDGHAIFEVKKVGDATEFGRVAEKSTEISGEETPLNQQLDKLAKLIGVIGFGLALFTFLARFIKDIAWHEVVYTTPQFYLLCVVLISVFVSGIKVWLPIIYDAFELLHKEKQIPKIVDEKGWLMWIGIGCGVFVVLTGIGWIFGINPLVSESWITVDMAGKLLQYLMVSVALIVVAVPEGLPMSVTLSLALSMRKMLKSNNLVRKMHACETMGAATVICTDKTGTLTQNKMQVTQTSFYGLHDKNLNDDLESILIKEGIAVNTTAYLDFSDNQNINALGNPTEGALLLWLYANNINYLPLRESASVVEQLTFSTERKYMATVVISPILNKKILYVKGAPEIILELCKNISGTVTNEKIKLDLLNYQQQAMRTIGFAYQVLNDKDDVFFDNKLNTSDLTFLGIAAISDPVREDVPAAIDICHNAGIDVKIVTGDTMGTAKEIGKQIGILSPIIMENEIMSGPDFEKLNDDDAASCVNNLKVLCRARPTDKQRLVTLLQQNGAVVAVTGDGTNDAPALNHAHVGLSMGSGTAVAKEASDITLIDDSFSSITKAVLWGRTVYLNIQRFILFQLTINVAALIIDFIGAMSWGQLPLTVTQLLWINLIMDTFAAGALASLPPDNKVMSEQPRNRYSFIVNKKMATLIFGVGLFFVAALISMLFYFENTDFFQTGIPSLSNKELTVFFTFFVMLQFWNMFNAKAYSSGKSAFHDMGKSYGFILVACVILIGQIIIVELGGDVFRTVPLSLTEWIVIIGSTSIVLWVGEVIRFFQRKSMNK